MRRLFLYTFIFLSVPMFAQTGKDKNEKDKQYVEKIKSLFSLRPFVNQNIDIFSVNYNKSDESAVLYRPATGMNVGGEIAFSFLQFSYQRNVPFLQPELPLGFEPEHQRIGFDMGGKVFGLAMTFQKNSGFYVIIV